MTKLTKTLIQCDFDGTVTEEDVSFLLLDAFADGQWRQKLKDHQAGKISLGRFNTEAFAMIKASRSSLLKLARREVKIRAGFPEMVASCRRQGYRFVIVSNGLDFYIKGILSDLGLGDIEVFAARTHFNPEGLKVQYLGPDGRPLDTDFKKAYTDSFLGAGYQVLYIGNGTSDLVPARQCHHIFATASLLNHCQADKLDCTPFTNFSEVLKVLETWP